MCIKTSKTVIYKWTRGKICPRCNKGRLERPGFCRRDNCNCAVCKTCKAANF